MATASKSKRKTTGKAVVKKTGSAKAKIHTKVQAKSKVATKPKAKTKSVAKPAPKKKVTKAQSAPKAGVTRVPAIPKAPKAQPKSPLLKIIEAALADMKAVDVKTLDVSSMTDVADYMVIASGNSDRHVRAIAENVMLEAKRAGFRPMGAEGERDGEWALVDLHDVIVHVMLPRVRDFYRLENLWDISAARREATTG